MLDVSFEADMTRCPLLHRKRTSDRHRGMSGKGQKQTHAPQQLNGLFDHLVCAGEQCRRDRNVERLRRLEIDHQFKTRRLLHRQITSL